MVKISLDKEVARALTQIVKHRIYALKSDLECFKEYCKENGYGEDDRYVKHTEYQLNITNRVYLDLVNQDHQK